MRKSKILVLALTLALLITSALALNAMAEDTAPTLEIASKNLSYEDNIKLLFAVKAENIGDAEVKLNVYEADPADNAELTPVTVSAAYTPANSSEIGIADHYVFFTEGIAAKVIHKQVYVQATVTVDGAEYKSAVERYSIVEYCHEMIAKDTTDATAEAKYNTVIEYGAAIQSFLTDDGKYSGALANEYKYVTIDGGTLDGRYDSGIYLPGVKVTPTIEGATKLVTADGEVVDNAADYTVGNSNVSFAKADAKALATETFDNSQTLPSCVSSQSTYPDLSSNVLNSYSVVTPSIITVEGHTSNALKVTTAYGASKAVLNFTETTTAEEGATTVEFEADMMIDWGSNSTSAEFFNLVLADSNNTVAYNLVLRCTGTAGSLGLAHRTNAGGLYGDTKTYLSGQDTVVGNANADWFKLRIVYTYSADGLSVTLYKDGTLMDTVTSPATADTYVDDANITNAYIIVNGRNSSAHTVTCDVAIDNVVFRKIAE